MVRIAFAMALLVGGTGSTDESPPATIPPATELKMTVYTKTDRLETVLDTVIAQDLCVEWTVHALAAGWPLDEIPRLLRVIYRESRCLPDACGETDRPDLRKCRDWGLTQINDYSWKSTVRDFGMEMTDMWNPHRNLEFALYLYELAEQRYGCGWQPWMLTCRT